MAAGDIIIPDGKITPEILQKITNEVVNNIQTTSKDPGQYEVVNSLQDITSIPVFQQTGATYKLVRVLVSILKGVDGKEVHLQSTETHLQWRWTDGMWSNLIAWADLKGDPGDTPVFRTSSVGIEWKYDSEEDSAWKILVKFEVLKLKFSDLTDEQITAFWRAIPDDVLAMFQKPATDAAADARKEITNMRQLEATVEEQEEARENFYSQVQAKEQARQNDEIKRQEAAKAQAEAERLRGLKEDERNATFDAKVREATDAAAEAKTQGDYAKKQGDKAGNLMSRVTALEEGKVDGGYSEEGLLQLTSGGLPIGDPIEVGSGSGGGGGTAGISCKVKAITDTLISTVSGASVRIGYSFTSIYADDGSETGDGTATYTINSQKVATEAIQQGNVYFDVTKWLQVGTNTIKVTVKDSTGQSRSVAYTVDVISMSISDSYDDAQINSGNITYRYTPVGAIEKTIHFILDGTELEPVVTSESNKQLSQVIPAQVHGAHRLEVYMTATVNGIAVKSNTLTHDLVCTVSGNNTIIVASSFNQTTAKQYDRLSIPFVIYNPAASTSQVVLSVNGTVLSEQTVDRIRQLWNYRITQPGELALKIASGSVSRSFSLTVSEADVVVEAETADLELYLTSQNRSNNDNNRDEWKSGDIMSTMTGFNWKTNGWVTDDNGSTCLRVSGGASVDIPLELFRQDLRSTGKTIEIEFLVRDVYRYDTPVISCWSGERGILITSQSAQIKSEQSDVTTRFKDLERIRLAFVIEKRADNRLLSIYVNGIKSATFQYPETDNFMQLVPAGITIGASDATVDVYTIRSYNNNLNRYQLLDNYIADIDDYDRKIDVYQKNDIYDAYGNISFSKVRERIDVLVLEGDLPQYKGDKKTNKIYYYSTANDVLNWWANIKNNVQGTSSQYYPRKNYKFELIDGLTYINSADHADMFQLTDDVLPASIFCIKTDFAESSGTHNTGVANMADSLLKEMGILTEAQKENPKARTTVAGKPCALFHKATPDSEPVFIGKVNFNTDKAAEDTFGFKDGDESWEFLNNTSDMALFKSADFTKWQETIEARYPDGGADITNVKVIFDWVISCKGDPDKFKAEYSQYFDKDMLVFYALITLVLGMTDQRAKNMFLTRYRGKLWLFILYDNDTLLPINNEGLIALLYNVEISDTVNGANVWNGADSELWKLVDTAFADEIREMYYTLRQRNVLSYDRMMDYLYTRQAGKWCEAIYNEDGYYKYEQPLIEGYLDYSQSHENPQTIKTGAYLYALQGSREMYGKWIWKNRFLYLDSKFLAGSILGDTAVFRTYTPAVWAGIEPCADITLTAFNAMYFNVKWGSVTKSQRVGFNETVKMTAPEDMQFNDTETIIYGASLIASLGDLSPLYPGTVDVSKMVKLKELIVGSGVEGYQNRNLHTLSIGENRLLKKLDVRNCPEYSEPIDVRNCTNIEEIYAQGTAITAVNLPEGGNLSKLYLPGTITNLTLKNQPKLTNLGFSLAGVEKLTTIVYENTGVDIVSLIYSCLGLKNPVLSRVRLIGINGSGANLDTLHKLTKIGGIDEKGNNVDLAIITGKFQAAVAREDQLADIRAAFPELTVTYLEIKPPTVTTFSFTSSQNESITNSSFECNFPFVKKNERTYTVTADDGETIEFTFKCDNHVDYSNTYLVEGTRTQTYSPIYIPLIKLRVNVYGTSTYVAEATVIANGVAYISDSNGYANIRTREAIEGTVVALGYKKQPISVPIQVTDYTGTIYLYQTVAVTFVVIDDYSNFVQGSEVTCDGETKVTNQYGECVFDLAKGTLAYTVTNKRYNTVTGNVIVSTSAKTQSVTTKINWETYAPDPNGNIQMMVGCESSSYSTVTLSITSNDVNYSIDWADGTIDNALGDGTQTYSRVFTARNWKNIEVKNCEGVTACKVTSTQNLKAYWSVGNSLVSGLNFNNYARFSAVGVDIFKNDAERTSMYACFYGCKLSFIPEGLTDPLVNVTDWRWFLRENTTLESPLPELWKRFTEDNIKKGECFKDCSKASNWNNVPIEWGGPLYVCYPVLAIFKNNTWYLNQDVKVNGQSLNQEADGTYKGEVYMVEKGNVDIVVNGEVVDMIALTTLNNKRDVGKYIFLDNCSEIYTENKTFDLSIESVRDEIIGESEWEYDQEKGGMVGICSRPNTWSYKSMNINLPCNSLALKLYYKLSFIYDNYCGTSGKYLGLLYTSGLNSTVDCGNIHVTNYDIFKENDIYVSLTGFRISEYTAASGDYVCIKSITCDAMYLPSLPSDFDPNQPKLSGVVLADNRAMEYRLTRIETALGFND